jgi:hypothetical protein
MLNQPFSIVVLFDYVWIVWCVYVVLFLCYSLYDELRVLLREVKDRDLQKGKCGDPAYHCMCSMQVVDITPMKHRLTSITSIRVVQQKHRRSTICLKDYNFQHIEDLQNLLNR